MSKLITPLTIKESSFFACQYIYIYLHISTPPQMNPSMVTFAAPPVAWGYDPRSHLEQVQWTCPGQKWFVIRWILTSGLLKVDVDWVFYLQLSLHDGFKDGYDIWHIHTSYTIIRMIYVKRHEWYLFNTFHINQVLMSSGSWTSKCIFGFQFAASNIFGGHEYIQGIMTCHLCSCFTHLDVGLTTPLEVLEI